MYYTFAGVELLRKLVIHRSIRWVLWLIIIYVVNIACSIGTLDVIQMSSSGKRDDDSKEYASLERILAVSNYSMAHDSDGNIWFWGDNQNNQIHSPTPLKKYIVPTVLDFSLLSDSRIRDFVISNSPLSSSQHSFIIDEDGNLQGWGENDYMQLGFENTPGMSSYVRLIDFATMGQDLFFNRKINTIFAGDRYSIAVDINGIIMSWGNNDRGQLGLGSTQTPQLPREIPSKAFNNQRVIEVAIGYKHILARTTDDQLWAWGNNYHGQLALPVESTPFTGTPHRINLKNIIKIAAGKDFSMALDTNGVLWYWGKRYNQTEDNIVSPVRWLGDIHVVGIAAGWNHALALDIEGNLWSWGDNNNYQLGRELTEDSLLYGRIYVENSRIRSIAAGYQHSLAIDTGGNLWAWGNNTFGQLGTGNNKMKKSPVMISNNYFQK